MKGGLLMNRRNRKGFTLAELLIVVAIIAVLVAISIPIFTSQMTKAKIAVDQSNVRSAKAAAAAEYMTNDESGDVKYIYDGSKVIKLGDNSSSNTSDMTADLRNLLSKDGYGKTPGKYNSKEETGAKGSPENGYIEVTINGDKNNKISAEWVSNISINKGNLSKQSLADQLKNSNLDKSSVIVFTASEGTTIDGSNSGSGKGSLVNLFEGYSSLKIIDLSKANLKQGDALLFDKLPDSVEEIVLPKVESGGYNIVGNWYDENGNLLPDQKWSKELDGKESSRIEDGKAMSGQKIYRHPPVKSN